MKNVTPFPRKKGMFIVLEGPDGSGKDTQAKFLHEYLVGKGCDTVLTTEPTSTSAASQKIRLALQKKERLDPFHLQELFVEDRREHVAKTILPALRARKIVLSVRYLFSTVVYGSIQCEFGDLKQMNEGFPIPDATFVLMVSPAVSMKRAVGRVEERGGSLELFEEQKRMKHVAAMYSRLPKFYKNIHLVNGERGQEEIFSEIKAKVDALLN